MVPAIPLMVSILVGVVFIVIILCGVLVNLYALSGKLDDMANGLAKSSLHTMEQNGRLAESGERIELALKAMQAEPKKEETKPRPRLRPATASEVRSMAEAEGFEAQ